MANPDDLDKSRKPPIRMEDYTGPLLQEATVSLHPATRMVRPYSASQPNDLATLTTTRLNTMSTSLNKRLIHPSLSEYDFVQETCGP
ncbi:MAG: hypothetical protein EOO38_32495 [Cytophagaceae bacterium]|nr:MAG: hypothetical protein EOO38_32495 [Cytophagaceae bacterium]